MQQPNQKTALLPCITDSVDGLDRLCDMLKKPRLEQSEQGLCSTITMCRMYHSALSSTYFRP